MKTAAARPSLRLRWFRILVCHFLAMLLWAVAPLVNATPELQLPLDCQPGKECWVMHYVDLDPGPGAQDIQCKKLTYDGHKGTDFAIRDLAAMEQGVQVFAAAPGIVSAVRDGMEDRAVTITTRHEINGKECGNGVMLEHENGWTTQYCHMKQGSLQVRSGDRVKAGQVLGQVGLSGETEFPHLHFVTRQQNDVIDPFSGAKASAGCRTEKSPLWEKGVASQLVYRPFVTYYLGFSDGVVTAGQVRSGALRDFILTSKSPALVFWVDTIGIYPGDKMTLRIIDPNSNVLVSHTETFDSFNIRRFQFVGKKRRNATWLDGLYRGEIVLSREINGDQKEFITAKEVLVK